MYSDPAWEKHLSGDVESIKIPSVNRVRRAIIKFLILAGFPVSLLRLIFRWIDELAEIIISQKADLNIFPSQELFLSYMIDVPSIGTIHDLMHRYQRQFSEVSKNGRHRYREKHFSFMCEFSKGVLVDSKLGKKQVCESYGVSPDKIFILPFIPSQQLNQQVRAEDFQRKYRLPRKFIFYPAQFWSHKNHKRLILAVNSLRMVIPDIQLLLVGSSKNAYKDVVELVHDLDLQDIVHFMGFVPDNDLPEFYRRARAMIMPTFFGPTNIPPLEAFYLGCPAGVSNVYSMPEQVGDAALLFDPSSVEDIAGVIKRLWTDDDLCNVLIKKGKEKSRSWGQPQFNNIFAEIIEKSA